MESDDSRETINITITFLLRETINIFYNDIEMCKMGCGVLYHVNIYKKRSNTNFYEK